MKRLTLWILGGAMLSSFAAARDTDSEFKAFMKATIPKLEKAFDTMDLGFFDKISTADFTDKANGQQTKKAEMLAQMKQQFAMTKTLKSNFKLLSTKASGNTGVAMTWAKATMTTKPQGKEKSHTMVVEMWEKQTWVRDGKSWKIKLLEATKPVKMTMDGKPSKMGG